MYPKSDLLEALSINTWFAALPLAERKAMVRAGEVTTFRAGEMLYRKGDAGASFVGLVEGAFKVSTLGEDGREAILAVMEPGNWFGESSLLDGLPRPHDVTAIHDRIVLAIGVVEFERLMRRPAFARALGALLCSRVRVLYSLVEDAMLRSTRTRIARRLLALARGDATMAVDARARVTVSQEALAMMLGIRARPCPRAQGAGARWRAVAGLWAHRHPFGAGAGQTRGAGLSCRTGHGSVR
ncbi:MAG: Crp/Fnr family transcriptional regulator [Burkholderiaceae bacterium]